MNSHLRTIVALLFLAGLTGVAVEEPLQPFTAVELGSDEKTTASPRPSPPKEERETTAASGVGNDLNSTAVLPPFPLKDAVATAKGRLAAAKVNPTGLKREDYVGVVNGIANYFQHFQASDGRIIDPFLHTEWQYSTPCYAWACAALVASGKQTNLLESGALAFECAVTELVEDKAANNHGDFFTFPLMLAYENLRDHVPVERRRRWEKKLAAIEPEKCYRDVLVGNHKEIHNWNVVALSGEYLRHQDGFTGLDFVERYLKRQLPWFTATGQYRDPNVPMAYDHFPRHFLAAVLHRGYGGEYHALLEELIERGAWTSLLMQSPNGELPTGGRSAQHQWNEAIQCVTYETRAAEKQEAGDAAAASAFKRAAHLALESVQRWQRPSGELWIVKNRFDPAVRHGFEGYSAHSQYNLLAASMLATAWLFADDSIPESACPADVGGFVFELPEFHKIFANCGGLYLELDTAADPHYNSTGLIRVHKAGCESLIGPTDSGGRAGLAIMAGEKPWAVGVAWPEGKKWQSLAGLGAKDLKAVHLSAIEATPQRVRFSVQYELQRTGATAVVEYYDLSPLQVSVTVDVEGKVSQLRVRFPAFATDGQNPARIITEGSTVRVELNGSRQTFSVQSPAKVELHPTGSLLPSRNGYFQGIEGTVKGNRATYILKPERLSAKVRG